MDELFRPRETYGDVELSIQASQFHYCSPRTGDARTPLEFYESVEIALMRTDSHKWITQPSTLGIDGFDDLWSDGEDVASWVPLPRVGELQVALVKRMRAKSKEVTT